MNDIERRFFKCDLRVENKKDGEGKILYGIGVPYDMESRLIDEDHKEFVEYIRKGAFDDTLRDDSAEVMMLYSHDWDAPLARRTAGNLKLTDGERGINYEAFPPDTTRAQDLLKDIRAGNIQGTSFGFIAKEDNWYRDENGRLVREVLKGILYEISPVVSPAYTDTTIASRSCKKFRIKERYESKLSINALKAARLRLLRAKSSVNNKQKDNI